MVGYLRTKTPGLALLVSPGLEPQGWFGGVSGMEVTVKCASLVRDLPKQTPATDKKTATLSYHRNMLCELLICS